MPNYQYAAGVIRSLEARLLSQNDLERMVDAPDLESAFRVFYDTDYADNLTDVQPRQFRKALDEDLQQAKDLLLNLVGDNEDLRNFLFVRNDIRNIKLLFKAKFLDQDLSKLQEDLGVGTAENLYKYIIDEDSSASIPKLLKTIIDQAKEDLADKENDPYYIDTYFDEVYFQTTSQSAKNLNNDYIKKLFSLQHKSNTLKFFVRAKLLNKDISFVKDFLPAKYLSAYEQDLDEALRSISWHRVLEKPVEEFINDKDLSKFEKNLEDAELEFVKKTIFIASGPELIVAYFCAKRNAIRNVRLIMTGKMNKVPAEKIKTRVREIYKS